MITYEQPVGNALPTCSSSSSSRSTSGSSTHGNDGKDLKKVNPEDSLPLVVGGAFTITEVREEGRDDLREEPRLLRSAALRRRRRASRSSRMRTPWSQALPAGELDTSTSCRPTRSRRSRSDDAFVVERIPGFQANNFIFNSNPDKPKNRELLDPVVREAVAYAINRQEIADVVCRVRRARGEHRRAVRRRLGEPDLQPEPFDADHANQMLDDAGYAPWLRRHRVARTARRCSTRSSATGVQGVNRAFESSGQDFEQIGVEVRQKPSTTRPPSRRSARPTAKYLRVRPGDVGLGRLPRPGLRPLGGDAATSGAAGATPPTATPSTTAVPGAGRDGRPGRAPGDRLADAGDASTTTGPTSSS